MGTGDFVVGVVLATAAAASLALSMVTQRFALSCSEDRLVVGGLQLSRNALWVAGLVGYGAANGLYVAALQYGPLSVMASVFTTLLIFNCVFARCLLGEALTPPKLAGCATILAGVVLVVVGSPKNIDVDLSAGDVSRLLAKPLGAAYLAVLLGAVAASVLAIREFEKRYPLNLAKTRSATIELDALDKCGGGGAAAPGPPPPRLDDVMAVVYPASLGLDEAIAHLTMKAAVSMVSGCVGGATCGAAVVWVFAVVWIGASLATLWWLRNVFARYEVTDALPVEYGAVNAASVLSGLLFYGERRFMTSVELALVLGGVLVILAGIAVGRRKRAGHPTGVADEMTRKDGL